VLPVGLSTCPEHCSVLRTQTVCQALVPGSPGQYGHVSYCKIQIHIQFEHTHQNLLRNILLARYGWRLIKHYTFVSTDLSRMQETRRLSTSQASIFSSFEMNGMCILVYGVINLMSTCVRMLRSRSATTWIIFVFI
jgi:hypothetical protein